MSQTTYHNLIQQNQQWVSEQLNCHPHVFTEMAEGQTPPFLCIGCSDSRLPLNIMTNTGPGELFIHRNVANQIRTDDASIQAALYYAVYELNVSHIIVCGHSGCGGVTCAYHGNPNDPPSIKEWVQPIRDLYLRHQDTIHHAHHHPNDRIDALAVLNIKHGIRTILEMPSLQAAFRSGSAPAVHGWLCQLNTGHIREVITRASPDQVADI